MRKNASRLAETLTERFWAKVDKRGPGECWPWMAGTCRQYGFLRVTKAFNAKAHRVSYEIHNGPIPAGMHVLHSCDNPPCVNPEHLRLGTQADNMRDASERGRFRKATPWTAKITERQAAEVKRLIAARLSRREIAELLSVTLEIVKEIAKGRTWRHVPGPRAEVVVSV